MRWIFTCLLFFSFLASGQNFYPLQEIKEADLFIRNTARTAFLLQSGIKENTPAVKILVYGQSISQQDWWKLVKVFLEERYPNTRIEMINKAIGGFSSERLKLMVENDVVPFYPDLILFHDYGNDQDYEKIIRTIRSRTTAEIAIQTDHIAVQDPKWHDRHSQVGLKELCVKYKLAYLDVRTHWRNYLKANNIDSTQLLSDNVHLNAHGNYLMAEIVKGYLKKLPEHIVEYKNEVNFQTIKKLRIVKEKISLPIHGNRVDVIWKSNSTKSNDTLSLRINENSPCLIAEGYFHTRPSINEDYFLANIGQPLTVELSGKQQEEEWSLTILKIDSVKQEITFSLKGALTGEDGTGTSTEAFKSKSGKIIIKPEYWFIRKTPADFEQFSWVRPGDIFKWEVKCMCRDEVTPDFSSTTILKGIRNGKHLLQLEGMAIRDIESIKVYRPYLD